VIGPPTPYSRGTVTYEDRAKGIDWRTLIRKNHDATTNASGSELVWDGNPSYLLARQISTGQYDGQQAIDDTALGLQASHVDSARQLAIGDFIKKAKSKQHEFGAGEFLGEIAETLRFVGHPISSFRRYSRDYLRRMQGKAIWVGTRRSKRQRLASAWLGYRFGALPLLGDIDSAMEELANTLVGKPPTLPVNGKGKFSSATNVVTTGTNLGKWDFERRVSTKNLTEVKIRGVVNMTIPTQIIWTPGTIRVFQDFIPTLLEVMPWSWALDYFSNIGDIISSLTYLDCNLGWVNQTRRSTKVTKEILTYKPNGAPGWLILDSQGRFTTTTSKVWDRTRISPSSLVPTLVLKTPFGKPLQEANLCAALFQTFGTRNPRGIRAS